MAEFLWLQCNSFYQQKAFVLPEGTAEIEKRDYTKALKNDVKGLRIAVPKEFFGDGINKEVKEIKKLKI